MTVSSLKTIKTLQSFRHSQLLDIIDKLREQGLSDFLPLPQLIVCGDQSSGKSSVLEAISGVPFPKKDSLCTRFATEVVLRRSGSSEDTHAFVSIIPSRDRSEIDQENLRNFSKALSDVSELPDSIEKAKEAMGLGSHSINGNAFSTDVLRLEVTGPDMPQLTIVDLPGLIHSENKHQTAQDVEMVSMLVKSYMSQERSIILAVVSAKNDIANQIVLKRAREQDPLGQRTLGIITKPDTLRHGSDNEASFLNLAKNQDVQFKLGWHVVRNLDSQEITEKGSRDEVENEFFRQSNWKTLPSSSVGVKSLRKKLSDILFDQISRELPSLMSDIEGHVISCQTELTRLGRSRKTEQEQRLFLAELGQRTYVICRAGCNGYYDDPFFRPNGTVMGNRRFRALIQNQGIAFAKSLNSKGSKWVIDDEIYEESPSNQITKSDAIKKILWLLHRSRGRELPGTFDPMLITEVFQEYCSPWQSIAEEYIFTIWKHAKTFLAEILQSYADDSAGEMYTRQVLDPEMDTILVDAKTALEQILTEMSRHALTFDVSFMEEVKKLQSKEFEEASSKLRERAFARHDHIDEDAFNELLHELNIHNDRDVDRSAARQVLINVRAYYNVALRRFKDNVPSLVVERVIVDRIVSIFQPSKILRMPAELVQQIAGESPEKEAHRESLEKKLEILHNGEATCRRYVTQESSDTDDEIVAITPTADVLSESESEAEGNESE